MADVREREERLGGLPTRKLPTSYASASSRRRRIVLFPEGKEKNVRTSCEEYTEGEERTIGQL